MCLPHEDQKGVVVLRSRAPPAGQTLRCSSCHSVNCQHFLHGTDGSGNHRVPPLTSLSAVSPGKGCLFRAAAAGGALILKSLKRFHNASCLSEEVVDAYVLII